MLGHLLQVDRLGATFGAVDEALADLRFGVTVQGVTTVRLFKNIRIPDGSD